MRGGLAENWFFDLSAVFGSNDVDFFMKHTINPQLLAKLPHGQRSDIPTDYFPGSYTETDYTLNLDLFRPLYLDIFFSPLNLALGIEYREERFKVESGGGNSWFIDDRPGGLAEQGFGIGSNGFTGFGPRLAGEFSRGSYAAYLDLEVDLTTDFSVGLAGRYEDHEGVGDTLDVQQLLAQGVADFRSFTSVRFYTNDFDTTTQGIDFVVNWPIEVGRGVTNLSLAGNWTDTRADSRNPDVIDDKRVIQLERNTPSTRFALTVDHLRGPWRFLLRTRYYDYDGYVEFSTDDASARLDAGAKFLVDAEIGHAFTPSVDFVLGAENLLDEYPTRQTANVSGLLYAETSPFNPNGGYYYLRAIWKF